MPACPATTISTALHDAAGSARFRIGFANPAAARRPRVVTATTGLIWVLAGTGRLVVNDNAYPLRPGAVFLRIPNQVHGQYLDHSSRPAIAFCALPAGCLAHLHDADLISDRRPVRQVGLHDDLLERWSALTEECSRGRSAVACCASAIGLCTVLLERAIAADTPETAFRRRAEALLRRNACNRRPLAALISDEPYITWRQRFTRCFGMSPGAYRIAARLERAEELLLSTDMPIKQIATTCGYDDVHNFARQFKHHLGRTPAQFRRQC